MSISALQFRPASALVSVCSLRLRSAAPGVAPHLLFLVHGVTLMYLNSMRACLCSACERACGEGRPPTRAPPPQHAYPNELPSFKKGKKGRAPTRGKSWSGMSGPYARLRRVAGHVDVSKLPKWLRIEERIAQALLRKKPVVALESTIISHGMPYPQNVETALRVEETVRRNGAEPATIAILDGVVHVGLSRAQLERLGKLGEKCQKCSRRDLGLVVSKRGNGATTVAATMYIASLAGIRVFVTGGIGGVHRGAETTFDVSADLNELGRTPVAVICAGVKSILDIPKTLEYLETQGVPVVGYGVKEFPAFFTRRSGSKAPLTLDTPCEVAGLVAAQEALGLKNGVVVGVPVPKSEQGDAKRIQKAIDTALRDASKRGIEGRHVTPFLLDRVNRLTKGHSLKANISLVLNNARVGSRIAVELAKMRG